MSLKTVNKAIDAVQLANDKGEYIARMLGLKKNRASGRYDTIWGDKTATGLYNSLERIISESLDTLPNIAD